jgi:flagella basal body P-ring formation protein FlgA
MFPMLLNATAIISLAALSAAATSPDALVLAGLRERYPAVVRWNIKPFTQVITTHSGGSVPKVLLLGPRSAVQLGGKVYWYSVEGFQTVVTASRRISAGEALDARAGHKVELNVLAAACEPLTDLSRLSGSRATRFLRPNEIMCERFIEPRPLVTRGDSITVRYQGHSISVTTRGIAQSDGAIGDTLTVRTLQGKDVYSGVVSGVQEVTVHE